MKIKLFLFMAYLACFSSGVRSSWIDSIRNFGYSLMGKSATNDEKNQFFGVTMQTRILVDTLGQQLFNAINNEIRVTTNLAQDEYLNNEASKYVMSFELNHDYFSHQDFLKQKENQMFSSEATQIIGYTKAFDSTEAIQTFIEKLKTKEYEAIQENHTNGGVAVAQQGEDFFFCIIMDRAPQDCAPTCVTCQKKRAGAICDACVDGYHTTSTGGCQIDFICDQTCTACTPQTGCTSCLPNYHLVGYLCSLDYECTHTCQDCTIENGCSSCKKNYHLVPDTKTCEQDYVCDNSCTACTTYAGCTACNDGYTLTTFNTCEVTCPDNCEKCQTGSSFCLLCVEDEFRMDPQNPGTCIDGFIYVDPVIVSPDDMKDILHRLNDLATISSIDNEFNAIDSDDLYVSGIGG